MKRSLALITTTLAVSAAAPPAAHTYDFSLTHAVAKAEVTYDVQPPRDGHFPYATLGGRVRLLRVPAGSCPGYKARDLLLASFERLEAQCDPAVAPNPAECQPERWAGLATALSFNPIWLEDHPLKHEFHVVSIDDDGEDDEGGARLARIQDEFLGHLLAPLGEWDEACTHLKHRAEVPGPLDAPFSTHTMQTHHSHHVHTTFDGPDCDATGHVTKVRAEKMLTLTAPHVAADPAAFARLGATPAHVARLRLDLLDGDTEPVSPQLPPCPAPRRHGRDAFPAALLEEGARATAKNRVSAHHRRRRARHSDRHTSRNRILRQRPHHQHLPHHDQQSVLARFQSVAAMAHNSKSAKTVPKKDASEYLLTIIQLLQRLQPAKETLAFIDHSTDSALNGAGIVKRVLDDMPSAGTEGHDAVRLCREWQVRIRSELSGGASRDSLWVTVGMLSTMVKDVVGDLFGLLEFDKRRKDVVSAVGADDPKVKTIERIWTMISGAQMYSEMTGSTTERDKALSAYRAAAAAAVAFNKQLILCAAPPRGSAAAETRSKTPAEMEALAASLVAALKEAHASLEELAAKLPNLQDEKKVGEFVAEIELAAGGFSRSIERVSHTKIMDVIMRASSAIQFNLEEVSAEAKLIVSLDYKTAHQEGAIVSVEMSPEIHGTGSKLGISEIVPTISILGGPKIPILGGDPGVKIKQILVTTVERMVKEAERVDLAALLANSLQKLMLHPQMMGDLLDRHNLASDDWQVNVTNFKAGTLQAVLVAPFQACKGVRDAVVRLCGILKRALAHVPVGSPPHRIMSSVEAGGAAVETFFMYLEHLPARVLAELPGGSAHTRQSFTWPLGKSDMERMQQDLADFRDTLAGDSMSSLACALTSDSLQTAADVASMLGVDCAWVEEGVDEADKKALVQILKELGWTSAYADFGTLHALSALVDSVRAFVGAARRFAGVAPRVVTGAGALVDGDRAAREAYVSVYADLSRLSTETRVALQAVGTSARAAPLKRLINVTFPEEAFDAGLHTLERLSRSADVAEAALDCIAVKVPPLAKEMMTIVRNAFASPETAKDGLTAIQSKVGELGCLEIVMDPLIQRLEEWSAKEAQRLDAQEDASAGDVATQTGTRTLLANIQEALNMPIALVDLGQRALEAATEVEVMAKIVSKAIKQKSAITEAQQRESMLQLIRLKGRLEQLSGSLETVRGHVAAGKLVAPRLTMMLDNTITGLGHLSAACDAVVDKTADVRGVEIAFVETGLTVNVEDGPQLTSQAASISSSSGLGAKLEKSTQQMQNQLSSLTEKMQETQDTLVQETRMIAGKMDAVARNAGSASADVSAPKVGLAAKSKNRDKFAEKIRTPSSSYFDCPNGWRKESGSKNNPVLDKTIRVVKEKVVIPPAYTFGLDITIEVAIDGIATLTLGTAMCIHEARKERMGMVVPYFSAALLGYGVLSGDGKILSFEAEVDLELVSLHLPFKIMVNPSRSGAVMTLKPFLRSFSGQLHGSITLVGKKFESPAIPWSGMTVDLPQACVDTAKWRECPRSRMSYAFPSDAVELPDVPLTNGTGMCVRGIVKSLEDQKHDEGIHWFDRMFASLDSRTDRRKRLHGFKFPALPARTAALAGVDKSYIGDGSVISGCLRRLFKDKKETIAPMLSQAGYFPGVPVEKIKAHWSMFSSTHHVLEVSVCDERVGPVHFPSQGGNTDHGFDVLGEGMYNEDGVRKSEYTGTLIIKYKVGAQLESPGHNDISYNYGIYGGPEKAINLPFRVTQLYTPRLSKGALKRNNKPTLLRCTMAEDLMQKGFLTGLEVDFMVRNARWVPSQQKKWQHMVNRDIIKTSKVLGALALSPAKSSAESTGEGMAALVAKAKAKSESANTKPVSATALLENRARLRRSQKAASGDSLSSSIKSPTENILSQRSTSPAKIGEYCKKDTDCLSLNCYTSYISFGYSGKCKKGKEDKPPTVPEHSVQDGEMCKVDEECVNGNCGGADCDETHFQCKRHCLALPVHGQAKGTRCRSDDDCASHVCKRKLYKLWGSGVCDSCTEKCDECPCLEPGTQGCTEDAECRPAPGAPGMGLCLEDGKCADSSMIKEWQPFDYEIYKKMTSASDGALCSDCDRRIAQRRLQSKLHDGDAHTDDGDSSDAERASEDMIWYDTNKPQQYARFGYAEHLWTLPAKEQPGQTRFDRQSRNYVVEHYRTCSACALNHGREDCHAQVACFYYEKDENTPGVCRSCQELDEVGCRASARCHWPSTEETRPAKNSWGASTKQGARAARDCAQGRAKLGKGVQPNGEPLSEEERAKLASEVEHVCAMSEAAGASQNEEEASGAGLGFCAAKCVHLATQEECKAVGEAQGECSWHSLFQLCALRDSRADVNKMVPCEGPSGQRGVQEAHLTDDLAGAFDSTGQTDTLAIKGESDEDGSATGKIPTVPNSVRKYFKQKLVELQEDEFDSESIKLLDTDYYTSDAFVVRKTGQCYQCRVGPDVKIRCPILANSRRRALTRLEPFHANNEFLRDALYSIATAVIENVDGMENVKRLSPAADSLFFVCNERILMPGSALVTADERTAARLAVEGDGKHSSPWPALYGGFIVTNSEYAASSTWHPAGEDGFTVIEFTTPLPMQPRYVEDNITGVVFKDKTKGYEKRYGHILHTYTPSQLVNARQVTTQASHFLGRGNVASEVEAVLKLVNVLVAKSAAAYGQVAECRIQDGMSHEARDEVDFFGVSVDRIQGMGGEVHSNGVCMRCKHAGNDGLLGTLADWKQGREVSFPGLACGHSNSFEDTFMWSTSNDETRRATRFGQLSALYDESVAKDLRALQDMLDIVITQVYKKLFRTGVDGLMWQSFYRGKAHLDIAICNEMVLPNVRQIDEDGKTLGPLIVSSAKENAELYGGTLCMKLGLIDRCAQFAVPTATLRPGELSVDATAWRIADDMVGSGVLDVPPHVDLNHGYGSQSGKKAFRELYDMLPGYSATARMFKNEEDGGEYTKPNSEAFFKAAKAWRENGGKVVALYYDVLQPEAEKREELGPWAGHKLLRLAQTPPAIGYMFQKFLTAELQDSDRDVRNRPCKRPELEPML